MRKFRLPLLLLICTLGSGVRGQVQIDQSIDLTGGNGQRKITNLEAPVSATDAVNKAYVDNAVAAGGGSGPTMLSDESSLPMNLGDAIRHCRNLTEGGFTDWRLPDYSDFIAAASTDDTVDNDASSNYIHITTSDMGWFAQTFNSGASANSIRGIRLSDGARAAFDFSSPNPSLHVRCVR